MEINDNKVVSLIYELNVDGQIADKCSKDNPLEFIFGMGYLLPKFEENVKGLKVGDKFKFTLSPEEGYGVKDSQAIVDLPKNIFEIDGHIQDGLLEVGNTIPMMNANGQVMQGVVVSVAAESVKMDFNHPMADKTLNFSGEITAVREASAKELEEGLHGERKAKSCNGSCGGSCEGCGGCN